MMNIKDEKKNEILLLKQFNRRNSVAFTSVYKLYYKDFYMYAKSLYYGTGVHSEDIVHDIFLVVWQDTSLIFDNLLKIKAFVFIAIKNGYKNYLNHMKYEKAYALELENKFKFDVVECEVYTLIEEALGLLPDDCAQIMRMYFDGYKPDEIAEVLNKRPQTIYNKKQEALQILRKKISKDKQFILIFF